MVKPKTNWKKVAAITGAALIVGATAGAIVAHQPYSQADVEAMVSQAQSESFKKGVDSVVLPEPVVEVVEVIKEVEVPVEVEVMVTDTELIQAACDRLLYEDMGECQREVKAEDAALKGAFDFMEEEQNDFFDMLEEEGIVEDEDDVEVIKVYDDFDRVEILKSDFDDEEYKFKLRFKVEDTDNEVKKYVLATVAVEDGEYELKKVVEE